MIIIMNKVELEVPLYNFVIISFSKIYSKRPIVAYQL